MNELEFNDYSLLQNIKAAFYRLWKLKLTVVFSTAVAVLLAFIYITLAGDKYSFYSRATIYSAVYGSYSETVSGVTIMNTYSGILNSSRVCDRAAADIGDTRISSSYLQGLVNSGKISLSGVSTNSRSYGYELVLSTRLDSPEYVVVISNAMAKAFSSEINELVGDDVIQVFDVATHAYMTYESRNKLVIVLAGAAGFILSAMVIFLLELFSSKVYLISQCVCDKDELLGILPYNE